MKIAIPIAIVTVAALGAIAIFSSAYVVHEYEQVLVTEFGKPVGDPITEAGLHWRVPFIQKTHRFEKRLLEHDGEKTEIPTRDKKFIQIDTFARWRIVEPLVFYQSVRDVNNAITRLDDIIDSETRDSISGYPLIEAVRNSNRPLTEDREIEEFIESLQDVPALGATEGEPGRTEGEPALDKRTSTEDLAIRTGREKITREILENAAKKIAGFGIELVDVEIKSINYVSRVQEKVFDRMVSEREQIAEKYRAEGQKIHSEVQGTIERERSRILSEAYRKAETIRGEAEAEAARIYSESYGRDPEFYRFWKTLELYRNNLSGNTSLIISTDSDLFRYLKATGGATGVKPDPLR